jgi:prepilin peptidase CpaA
VIREFSVATLLSVSLAAIWLDLRTRRLPNWLTVLGLTGALLLRVPLGWSAALTGVEGAILALLLGVVLYAVGAMGAGDAKLMAALGGFLGPVGFLGAFAVGAVLGAAWALVAAARSGAILLLFMQLAEAGRHLRSLGRGASMRGAASGGSLTIPYGVPLALGAVIWQFAGAAITGALFS